MKTSVIEYFEKVIEESDKKSDYLPDSIQLQSDAVMDTIIGETELVTEMEDSDNQNLLNNLATQPMDYSVFSIITGKIKGGTQIRRNDKEKVIFLLSKENN